MIVFACPLAFWLLVLPFMIYFLTPAVKGMQGDALRIPFIADLKRIAVNAGGIWSASASDDRLSKKFWVLYFIWVCLVLALARPQIVGEPIRLKNENRDIMLVIDISDRKSVV